MADTIVHFRGIPTLVPRRAAGDDAATTAKPWTEFSPICSSTAAPVDGEMTTERSEITCPACRRILRLPKLARASDYREGGTR